MAAGFEGMTAGCNMQGQNLLSIGLQTAGWVAGSITCLWKCG